MRLLRVLPLALALSMALPLQVAMAGGVLQQTEGFIDYGETVSDRVTDEDGDLWTFDGREGDEIRIEMESNAMDTYLELLDPDGQLVAENDDGLSGTDSLIGDFVLSETGEYAIVASGFSDDTGTYSLRLERVDTDVQLSVGGPIEYGETVRGRVNNRAGDDWTFRGSEGDEIRIEMNSSSMDTYLELLGPDDRLVAENDDNLFGTDSTIGELVLSEGGEYTIVARGYDGNTGSYSLTLELIDTDVEVSSGGTISYGDTIRGSVDNRSGEEWTFDGRTGDIIRISMESNNLDTFIELRGPDGDTIAEDDDGGSGTDSQIATLWLAESGEYTIVARSFQDNRGSYRLTLQRLGSAGGNDTAAQLLAGIALLLALMALGVAIIALIVAVMARQRGM